MWLGEFLLPPSFAAMTFNPAAGIFTLESGTQIGPDLTRAAFLATPEGAAAIVSDDVSYSIFTTDGKMGLVAYFYPPTWPARPTTPTDLIAKIGFWLMGPEYPTGWDDFTPEADKREHVASKRWLTAQGVALRSIGGDQHEAVYPWGTVGAYYDFKNGTFYNHLQYKR